MLRYVFISSLATLVLLSSKSVRAADAPLHVVSYMDIFPDGANVTRESARAFLRFERKQSDCSRAELLNENRPNHMILDEVWKSEKAYEAFRKTQSFQDFHRGLQDQLASPLDERRLKEVLP